MARSIHIASIAIFSGLGVAFRVLKTYLTPAQFINIPLVFSFVSGYFFNALTALFVGLLTYLISDILIFPGPWTLINPFLAGIVSYLWTLACRKLNSLTEIFIVTFLSVLLFDITSSMAFYLMFGFNLFNAAIISIIGLFLPVFGGWMIGVGPITEFSTALLTCLLIKKGSVVKCIGKTSY